MDWQKTISDLEALGWSQTALAAEIGLTVGSVSDIKRGRTREPRGMAAVKLHALASGALASPAGTGGDRSDGLRAVEGNSGMQ